MAMRDAGVAPEQVDYINAHGTSTPYNDKFETLAIKKTFGEHAYKLAVSSTKSMTGHLLGAAGGIEAVFSVLSITERQTSADDQLRQRPTPNATSTTCRTSRARRVDYALSNSFGFGGTNAALCSSGTRNSSEARYDSRSCFSKRDEQSVASRTSDVMKIIVLMKQVANKDAILRINKEENVD